MKSFRWVLAGLAVPLLLVTAIAAGRELRAHSEDVSTAAVPPAGTAISLNDSAGSVFTPVKTGLAENAPADTSYLTPLDAFNKAFAVSTSDLPQGAAVMTGYFTMGMGPGAPAQAFVSDKLVYAIKWHNCGPAVVPATLDGQVGAPLASAAPSTAAQACNAWAFIAPDSGALVDMTWSTN